MRPIPVRLLGERVAIVDLIDEVSDGIGREMVVRKPSTGREARLLEQAAFELSVSPDGGAIIYFSPKPAFHA